LAIEASLHMHEDFRSALLGEHPLQEVTQCRFVWAAHPGRKLSET